MIGLDVILKRNDDCPTREVGGGLVIMAPAGDMTHSLDEIGAFIWRHLDGRRSLDEIVTVLTGEYDVTREQAAADLREFVEQLLAAGLAGTA